MTRTVVNGPTCGGSAHPSKPAAARGRMAREGRIHAA
jgi:hypothetical protein